MSVISKSGAAAAVPAKATTFHLGVNHAHAASGKWADVQKDPNKGVPPTLADPMIAALCKALSPINLVRAAMIGKFTGKPIAKLHLDWYLKGTGADFKEDANIDLMLRTDTGIQGRLASKIPKGVSSGKRSGFFGVVQGDYSDQDLRFAFGAIDRLDWEADFSAKTLHVWFQDRYEWHPVFPGLYKKLPGDVPRETNCVHAALVELKLSGAADFWMKGEATVPLSAITPGAPAAPGGIWDL